MRLKSDLFEVGKCFHLFFSYYQVSQNFWLAFFYGRFKMAVAGRTWALFGAVIPYAKLFSHYPQ